jgi:signal transduction histidine kinase
MPRLANPLRFSSTGVALVYCAASLLVLAMFAGPLWYSWRVTVAAGRVERLDDDIQRFSLIARQRGIAGLAAAIDTSVMQPERVIGRVLMLADAQGRHLAGNLDVFPRLGSSPGPYICKLAVRGQHIGVAYMTAQLPGGYHLLVGNNVDRFARLEKLFVYGLLGCSVTLLALAVAGALLMRHALLSRVRHIEQTTTAIVQGDLSSRLPTPATNDELDALARTLNRMLDQIEHLVLGVREVSNAIAHDLRTPLAALRYRLEELVLTRPSPEQAWGEIDAAILDVDQVLAIFNALLRLAEIDSGARRAGFADIDVARVAAEVVEFYSPLAELKGIKLAYDGPQQLPARGDALLVAQAIGNLIDNALKYVPDQGHIAVQAQASGDGAAITVADDGPGIPESELDKVAQRFYRVDPSRVTPGAGLGLSLVDAVARLHDGALTLASNAPGLRACLLLQVPPRHTLVN